MRKFKFQKGLLNKKSHMAVALLDLSNSNRIYTV